MEINVYLDIEPPTVTAQEKKVAVHGERPVFVQTTELKAARRTLVMLLKAQRPPELMQGALMLTVQWRFGLKGKHKDGEYRVSRPDTDNLQKLLKDCMTEAGFWKDDAQVCVERVEKLWSARPGIRIRVETITAAPV